MNNPEDEINSFAERYQRAHQQAATGLRMRASAANCGLLVGDAGAHLLALMSFK